LMLWPHTDEANYILQARHIADGLLPYRDFYDFVTPGSQLAGAIFIKLNGDFSVVGLRLLVLMGWLVEILLICDMARHHLPRRWLWVLAAFLWLTMSRYPVFQHHFWSGFWALL